MKPNKQLHKWSDHYTQRAKKEGFAARSVYKLDEIQAKFKLLKKGARVLDLGCSPGSWLQFASEIVGDKGTVTGIDLKPVMISPRQNMNIIQGDIFEHEKIFQYDKDKILFDVVMSDMAPSTSGRKELDAIRSTQLCEAALTVAMKVLVNRGHFVCKIFQGQDCQDFYDKVKKLFASYKMFKPKTCRKESNEIYIIGLEKKNEITTLNEITTK